MSWRIIYVEESDKLILYLDNVKVIRANRETIVPLSDINTIMIDNTKTLLSAQLLNRCADYNITVFTCDAKHTPHAVTLPLSGNYRSTHMLRKQLQWGGECADALWQYIVRMKITMQARALKLCTGDGTTTERLMQFAQEVAPGDPQNCEGLAARMYFRALFGADFLRDDETPINAALNYGYSIVRSQLARAIVAHGLNAHIGIFHRGPGNAFNLADDLIEPLRPIIDHWVYHHITPTTLFARKHRLALIALMTHKVNYDNKKVTLIFAINNIVERFIEDMDNCGVTTLTYPDVKTYDL